MRARFSISLGGFLLLGLQRTQIPQARLDGGKLVEIPVPAFLRELQLLDRRRQRSLQNVGFGKRLMVQQALARCSIGFGLQAVNPDVSWVAFHQLRKPCERRLVLSHPLQ